MSGKQNATLAVKAKTVASTARPVLQRQCACGQHTHGGECEECKKKGMPLQRKAANNSSFDLVPPIVHEVLRSPGQPLDRSTRAFFEPRFGYDFSHVRVHTDEKAAESARAVNAVAYTVGSNIVLDRRGYAPGTASGRGLLAHELTHVLQQRGLSPGGASLAIGREDDASESEADRIGAEVLQASHTPIATPHGAENAVHRQTDEAAQIVPTQGQGTRDGVHWQRLPTHALAHVTPSFAAISPLLSRRSICMSPVQLQRQPGHHGHAPRRTTPTLGPCRPVQDDKRPTAPWTTLQRGFQARCSSAAREVLGQGERALDAILHGRMPRAPHLPDARSSVDCACALGSPRQAAEAAIPVVGLAGPLALQLYLHFLGGSGTAMTIDVASMIRRSAGVRAKIRRSIGRAGMTGTTRLEQSDYGIRELQFAYGAIDCVQWTALPASGGAAWRSNPATQVRVAMLDYYEFHPARLGVSQCAHAACVQCIADGNAKNFWTSGDATVSWAELQTP